MAPSLSHTRLSQRQGDEKAIGLWRLPEMKSRTSDPVLETLQIIPYSGNRDHIAVYVWEPTTSTSSILPVLELRRAGLRRDMISDSEEGTTFEVQLFYKPYDNWYFPDIQREKLMLTDMEMKWRYEGRRKRIMGPPPSGFRHKLMEQRHDPDKDVNLIRAAYLSMNGGNFNVPDWVGQGLPDKAIYEQRTPLGNTVLHIAASYGNNRIVEKVAQDAPHLFYTVNSNYDTALHVAARAGHGSTIQSFLNSYLTIARDRANCYPEPFKSLAERMLMLGLTLYRNDQENTFFHEAFMVNSHNGVAILQAFEASWIGNDAEFKDIAYFLAIFATNNEGKSLLYLAIEVGCKHVVNQLLDYCDRLELQPRGNSPLLPPLTNRDKDLLELILKKKPNWIHLTDIEQGSFRPLHYAASMGYLEGASYLIKTCASCTLERDKNGFFPIHLASGEGHVEVVQELLKWCPDPTEMLDKNNGRNFLHIAAEYGKYKVVNYILQDPKLEKMINQKDKNGDTPLHLATRNWHPKIVHAFTWDKRVNLALLNKRHQTALDIADESQSQNPSLSQRLTWSALQSAGTPRSLVMVDDPAKEAPKIEQYKERVDTLIVVSTLIITASFAAGFTVPGDVDEGTAVNLKRHMFHLFIFSLTISLYGSISTTIILIWARLGDLHLTYFALKYAMPLLGIALGSLSLSFLAGVYLVVSKLSWLGTVFLVMGMVLAFMVLLLYALLWLPSSSTSPFVRYISYYPFLMLVSLIEADTPQQKPPRV